MNLGFCEILSTFQNYIGVGYRQMRVLRTKNQIFKFDNLWLVKISKFQKRSIFSNFINFYKRFIIKIAKRATFPNVLAIFFFNKGLTSKKHSMISK